MTAYKKNLLAWAITMTAGFVLIGAALELSQWFIVPFLALIYVPQFFLEKIVCPKCGTPVTYQGTVLGKPIRGGFIRRLCQECGWDLNRNFPL